MARELIDYYDPAIYGDGLEGFLNWSNVSMEYWLIPAFLFVFWGLAIYMATKNEYKFGGQMMLYSFAFFILGMIAKAFTQFNELVMFIFAIGMLVGLVISFIENAKS